MKQVLIALMVAFTFSTLAWGQKEDTIAHKKVGTGTITVTEIKDSKDAKKTTSTEPTVNVDPVSGLEYTDTVDSTRTADSDDLSRNDLYLSDIANELGITKDAISGWVLLSTIAVILIFGLPIVVIICVFFFKYKNRKAKYRLMEQALASGQPLPESFVKENFKESFDEGKRSDGIKQTFTGLGLFVFLWAITGSFGVGCVGLLVMCIGIGKWVTSMDKNRRDENK